MKNIEKIIASLTIAGNSIIVLWILYNGFNENFEGSMPEKVTYFGLIILLTLNSFLLVGKRK